MIGAFLKLNFRYIFTPAFPEQIWVVFYNFSPFPPSNNSLYRPLICSIQRIPAPFIFDKTSYYSTPKLHKFLLTFLFRYGIM